MKLTITTGDLADLVNPVLPLASRDDTVPTLGGVLVERKGRWITASATDRYRLGVSRIRAREGQEDFRAVIDAPDIRRIVTVFKPSKYNNPEIALTVESDTLTAKRPVGSTASLPLACRCVSLVGRSRTSRSSSRAGFMAIWCPSRMHQ